MMKYIFQVVQLKIHRDAFEHPVVRVQCVISNCLVFLCDLFLYMQEIPLIGSPKSNQIIKSSHRNQPSILSRVPKENLQNKYHRIFCTLGL